MIRTLVLLIALSAIPVLLFSQVINQIDEKGRKQGMWKKTYSNGVIRYEGQFIDDKPYGEFRYFYESTKLNAVTVFTNDGVVARTTTYYENGNKMAEGKYINQLKDSSWMYFSETDGKMVLKEDFNEGKLNGTSITYYPETGQPAEVIEYKNDIKNGLYLKYFSNGSTLLQGNYTNGLLEGDYTVYYPKGTIEVKGTYEKGLKTGSWSYYDLDGRQITEDEYKQEKVNE